MKKNKFYGKSFILGCLLLGLGACSDSDSDSEKDSRSLGLEPEASTPLENTESEKETEQAMNPLQLRFAASHNNQPVSCNDLIEGVGVNEDSHISIADLRFYVSNITLYDQDGVTIPFKLESNDFQLQHEMGSVVLIDLTGTESGACTTSSIAFAEGTGRVNDLLKVQVPSEVTVHSVHFDVGVPQAVMKDVIQNHTAEDAPSPLAEMYWSWASGYRHFVMNFTVGNQDSEGEGYIHIGSKDCGGDGAKALTDQEFCGLPNTAQVALENFDVENQVIALEVSQLLTDVKLMVPIMDSETKEKIGEKVGVACHSSSTQEQCDPIFKSLGLTMGTDAVEAKNNRLFSVGNSVDFPALHASPHSSQEPAENIHAHHQASQ